MDWEVLAIIFMTVVVPIWLVLHYIAKFRQAKSLSHADEETLSDLWQMAAKMEDRIEVLESILDDEVPGWRKRS
ncbi:MAG: envelope stress response membrane protein PspB [bacterium]